MTCWFKGRAKRRTPKLKDGSTAHIQFSTQERPLGSDLELPEVRATITVDHSDDPIGVKVVLWNRDNDGKAVSYEDINRFLGKNDPPVSGAKLVGDAQIISETAVRKKTDGEGSEAEEHRFTLRISFDEHQPFFSTTLGMLMADKAVVMSLTEAQVSLPAMPPKRKVGRPSKAEKMAEAQAALNLDGKAQAAPSAPETVAEGPEVVQTTSEAQTGSGSGTEFDFTGMSTPDLLAVVEKGGHSDLFMTCATAELNRREPAKPNAADDLLDAVDGIKAPELSPSTPAELREPTMAERASKARRKGKVAAEA